VAEDLQGSGVQVHHLSKRHRWDVVGFLWRIIQTLRRLKPTVLYSFLTESNVLSALLRPVLPSTRIIWGLRDSETDSGNFGLVGKAVFALSGKLSGWADLHICNSYCGARYYESLGYASDRLTVIPNGIDVQRFCPDTAARATVRAELGVDEDTLLLGLIGRLSPMKDHVTFLHGLAAAGFAQRKAIAWIIGSGPDAYLQEQQALARELGLESHIRWSPPRKDMPAVLNALDLLVSSSAYGEGFSNVTGEAMSCGKPCVVTDVGDSAMVVADTGWSVPARQPKALGLALQSFFALSAQERRAKGQAARARIVEHFTIPVMVQRSAETLAWAEAPAPPKRLLFIITALGSGGAELQLAQLVQQLDPQKFAPEVLSLVPGGKHSKSLQAAGIPVHTLGLPPGKITLGALVRLYKITRQSAPQLIIGWMYHANLLSALCASFSGTPVIWNIRQSLYDLAYEKRSSAFVIKLLAWLSWLPRTIFYNSAQSATQHEAVGYQHEKTVIVPNGIDTQRFQPNAAARHALHQELGLPAHTLLIGRVGRNTAMKDFPCFMQAAKILRQKRPELHFITAGTDTEKLPPQEHVHHLGERHDLPQLTAALDIACSSSSFGEGFPNIISESMACAVPCVATDIGDSAWLLDDPSLVIPAKNPQALANKLAALIELPTEQRELLGQKLRTRITKDFSLPSVVKQFEKIYAQ
jgi:glycosyltransferase involved in cell wall biosynthesis